MRCEKCGAFLDGVLVDVFNYDGSDGYWNIPIESAEESAAVLETTQNWTGYELSEEEMTETIKCPKCRQFPFESTEIQVYNIVRLVMFRRGDDG